MTGLLERLNLWQGITGVSFVTAPTSFAPRHHPSARHMASACSQSETAPIHESPEFETPVVSVF